MDAVQVGPLVLSAERLYAALGCAVFVLASAAFSRRLGSGLVGWAWNAVLLVLLGARLGFVAGNWEVYAQEPLTVLYVWQGGFAPLWGIAAGVLHGLWSFHKEPGLLRAAGCSAGLALVVWGGLSWGAGGAANQQAPALADLAAPLPTLAGNGVALADFAGQATVVNLWATWCPPCRREMPLLFLAAEAMPEVAMLLVNQGEGAEAIERYLEEELGLGYDTAAHVLVDARGGVGSSFRAPGLPTTLFFDAEGVLVHRHVGEISRAELLRRMDKLLE